MLKRFVLALGAFGSAGAFSRKVFCAEDTDLETEATENPVDDVLKNHPPATAEEIRGRLTTKPPEGDL